MLKPAAFLDRDGTVIEEVGYLSRIDQVTFFPWTVDAIRVLNESGIQVVVVTNQAGIARGYFDADVVRQTHDHINERLREGRAHIDAFYFCPHHPEGKVAPYATACECRKPKPGMVNAAAADLGIDLAKSVVIGDRWLDVELGRAAGCRTVLVRTGYGQTEEQTRPTNGPAADYVADNLMEAASWYIRHLRQKP